MSGPSIPPVQSGTARPGAQAGQVVQIVSLPDGLKNMARAMRLEGEVVGQNSDGSTRIKTPEGDIDIVIRGRQPQPGTRMEIDIPPGSPPRNATMRPPTAQPAPQPAQPQTPTTPPAQGQAPAPTQPAPQPVSPQPPADSVEVTPRPLPSQPAPMPTTTPATGQPPTPILATPVPVQSALPPLAPGQIVTLTPLPPEPAGPQAPVQTQPAISNAPGATPSPSSQIPASTGLISSLVNVVRAALPSSLSLPGASTQSAQPLPGQGRGAPPVMIMPLQAKVTSLVLPSGQMITLSVPDNTTAPDTPLPGQTAPTIPTAPGQNAASPSHGGITAPALPSLTVTVAQTTAQGQPILSIPVDNKGAVQNFVLQAPPASAPVGTQVTLQPIQLSNTNLQFYTTPKFPQTSPPAQISITGPQIGQPGAPAALPPAWRMALPLMQPASIWPAMDDLFQSFYQATPQAAQILGRVIPAPSNPGSFGPSALLFAAALKSGEIQNWIGEKKLDMLHKLGKADIVSRLSSETASLAGNTDAAATEWKSLPIPLLWQNEISKVLLHVRREPPEDDREQNESGTRFVMDLTLTRMGDVQLDGIVRGQRLDLIVRTQMPVSESMQDAMKKAYADALDGSGIYGELGFQGDLKQWVRVLSREDMIAATV